MKVPILRLLGLSLVVTALLVTAALVTSQGARSLVAVSPQHPQSRPASDTKLRTLTSLTRYPYLTDTVSDGSTTHATVNWATDQSQETAFVTYAEQGADASATRKVGAVRSTFQVQGVPESQWRAELTGLKPETTYVYRVFLGDPGLDLLGTNKSPAFTTPPAPGSSKPFSFAVLGDWGATDTAGGSSSQARLFTQLAASDASFALSAGDTAYPSGNQTNYGDLFQRGVNVSTVFGPSLYKEVGDGLPMFVVPGNHGMNETLLNVWPESAAASLSKGRFDIAGGRGGANAYGNPSVWYAFTVGTTRFYMLTASWPDADDRRSAYARDYAAHWQPSSAQFRWLRHDLATTRAQLKVAVFHFPLYSDNSSESSDPYLHRPGGLASLLSRYGVDLVFNGHAHIYERNLRQPGDSFVSYVTGTGGGELETVGRDSAFDAYAIGWNAGKRTGSAAGAAKPPTSADQVYSFLLVTVDGRQVTVKPTNALGQSFDVTTYHF
jgi:hypothetical protein